MPQNTYVVSRGRQSTETMRDMRKTTSYVEKTTSDVGKIISDMVSATCSTVTAASRRRRMRCRVREQA